MSLFSLVFVISPSQFITGSSTSTRGYGLMRLNNQFRCHIAKRNTKAIKTQITVKFRTGYTIVILTE